MIYGDMIGRWAKASPEKEALYDAIEDRRYTYGQLAREIDKMACFLHKDLNIRKGDRVACLALNRAEVIVLFFGLGRLGAVLVPLNFRLAKNEFIYFLEDAAPRAIFFDQDHQAVVERLKQDVQLPHYVCFDNDGTVGAALPSLWNTIAVQGLPQVSLHPEDPHLIIYTSGTTGVPKGVILTHGMLTWNAVNTILGWDMRSSDRTILHAAMFYTAGWNVFTLPLFSCRGSNILIRSFDPDLILDLIDREAVTVFFGVPTMFQMMLDAPGFAGTSFDSVRFMVSGGAPMSRDIFDTFMQKKNIRIWEGYGLTEVGPNNFMANGKLGTIGHPMPFMDVRLIDAEGREVPQGEEGEILLRGPNVCAGYLNKPEATADAIREGWFHTGDLGRIDADGHMAIAGRLKDMFISGGVNIYPAEIERVIEAHPAVAGAAVIGVPDSRWGEVGKAIVELKPGTALTLNELLDYLKDRVGRFKMPKYLEVLDELPHTPASGKIQKFLLKKKYGEV